MKTINVHTAFGIGLVDGSSLHFQKGVHQVDDEISEHWYTKANSTPVDEPKADAPNDAADEKKADEKKASGKKAAK